MATIAYSILGDEVVLFLSGREAPSESEWQEYTVSIGALVRRRSSSGGSIKFLVFADERGPNPKQRASIVETLQGVVTRTAVISSSMIARNLITAFGWLNFSVKGFGPTNLAGAAAYLELSDEQLSQVVSEARALAPTVGGVRCVEIAVGAQRSA